MMRAAFICVDDHMKSVWKENSMSWLYDTCSRGFVLILVITTLVWFGGCAPVQRLERGYLADSMMIFNEDPVEHSVQQLISDSREGSTGGYGVSGGGCACSQ